MFKINAPHQIKYRIIIRRPHDVPSIKDLGSKESKEKLDGSENL